MTTSEYDELVKRLGRLADVIDNGGAVDFPDWASVREAADAITRLSRDLASAIDDGFKVELSRDALAGKLLEAQAAVASAHTAGAMLMREEAAKYHDAEAERYRARLAKSERCRPVNLEYCDDLRNALADEEQAARNIRALPLPSPVAVQAVPEPRCADCGGDPQHLGLVLRRGKTVWCDSNWHAEHVLPATAGE